MEFFFQVVWDLIKQNLSFALLMLGLFFVLFNKSKVAENIELYIRVEQLTDELKSLVS